MENKSMRKPFFDPFVKLASRFINWLARMHFPVLLLPLALFLALAAIYLWRNQITYQEPGPAWAAFILAIVVIAMGVLLALDNARRAQEMELPSASGLDKIIEQWQHAILQVEDSKSLPELRQVLIAKLRVALLVSKQDFGNQLNFLQVFPGGKVEKGAFRAREGKEPAVPFVLKFDAKKKIENEIDNYKKYIQPLQTMNAGEPVPHYVPAQPESTIHHSAVTYNHIAADQPDRLKTFSQYYKDLKPEQMSATLDALEKFMHPLWIPPRHFSKNTLKDEYKRLTEPEKWDRITKNMCALGTHFKLSDLEEINANISQIQITTVPRTNPLWWVKEKYKTLPFEKWEEKPKNGVIHGDWHGGNILVEKTSDGPRFWLIDFAHTHYGPVVRDLARLEAEMKFNWVSGGVLQQVDFARQHEIETCLLPRGANARVYTDITSLPNQENDPEELKKMWAGVTCVRAKVQDPYLGGVDPRPYYLALLHATLPMLYYRDMTPHQKMYALISASVLCERLG